MNNTALIDIDFNFGSNDSQSVRLDIFDSGPITSIEKQFGPYNFKHTITIPTKLKFIISNSAEHPDNTGGIIVNRYVHMTRMSVGCIPVEESILMKLCTYQYRPVFNISMFTDVTTYWAHKGIVTIDFNAENFILWHLKLGNKFNI